MKNILTILSFVLFSTYGFSQASICLGDDITICTGSPLQINDCGNYGTGPLVSTLPYVEQLITFAPNPFAGTSINLSDDSQSGALPIGFNFCFFGNQYNQFYIGSNGWIAFTPQPTNYTSAVIPNTGATVPKNCIMAPWQDWHPGTGSNVGNYIKYQTLGTAPNRKLVVSWNQVPFFSCTTTLGTFQIVIYETTNIIETHITNKPACTSWAGGTATHGVHNSTGTVAFVIPGRNSTQWTVTNEGRRFSPTIQYQWGNTLGQTFPYNAGVLNIPSVNAGTVGYFLTYTPSTCATLIGTPSDTSWVTGVSSSVSASSTPDICSTGIGSVTATPGNGTAPFTFNWPTLGSTNQTVNNVSAGSYTVQMVDAIGCSSSANVIVGDTPANFSGTTTIVSCPGGADGTATATMTPVLGNITYQWDDPSMQTTQTATGLTAGTYTCIVTSDVGCQGNVVVNITEIPGMIATITNQSNVTCNSGNDGMAQVTVTQGTPTYTYTWNNSTSTSNVANDLYVGPHTVTITDNKGCVTTATTTLSEPARLQITTLTPPTQICPEDDILLSVTGTGGSSAYTFTWKENGVVIGTGTSITVDPSNTNTLYCVTLSEVCGSPVHDSCTIISFPIPIVPSLLPNKTEDCTPAVFEFTNTSTNGGEIATTYFEFSDGSNYLEIGNDSTSNLFIIPNFYSAEMTVTSIYGCVYKGSFSNIIEVKPLPIADFTFSSNPATFFETSIQLQDRSTVDVVQWDWYSAGSNPSYSYSKNPVFTFPQGVVGNYPVMLIVTTQHGCVDTAIYIMHIVQDVIFYAPNSFTPDGDQFNQQWKIFVEGIDIYNFELFIFNRWGEIIWESHDASASWDGTYNGSVVQAGTYVWRASAKDSLNDGKYEFNGYINVLK